MGFEIGSRVLADDYSHDHRLGFVAAKVSSVGESVWGLELLDHAQELFRPNAPLRLFATVPAGTDSPARVQVASSVVLERQASTLTINVPSVLATPSRRATERRATQRPVAWDARVVVGSGVVVDVSEGGLCLTGAKVPVGSAMIVELSDDEGRFMVSGVVAGTSVRAGARYTHVSVGGTRAHRERLARLGTD